MELVPGEPLSALISREGALGTARTLDFVAADRAGAGRPRTARGIVHRDVKPANLMVTPDGRIKVTDFGIARPQDHEPLTATGQVMGTAHYLAPELARGEPASAQSDVYALGVVMYECLAGGARSTGDNQVAVATAHLQQEPPPLPRDRPGAGARAGRCGPWRRTRARRARRAPAPWRGAAGGAAAAAAGVGAAAGPPWGVPPQSGRPRRAAAGAAAAAARPPATVPPGPAGAAPAAAPRAHPAGCGSARPGPRPGAGRVPAASHPGRATPRGRTARAGASRPRPPPARSHPAVAAHRAPGHLGRCRPRTHDQRAGPGAAARLPVRTPLAALIALVAAVVAGTVLAAVPNLDGRHQRARPGPVARFGYGLRAPPTATGSPRDRASAMGTTGTLVSRNATTTLGRAPAGTEPSHDH